MKGFNGILFASLMLSGCSVFVGSEPAVVEREVQDVRVPGTVYGAWTEQMVDDPKVPGSLDPEGHYYRLPHRTLVEIVPGRTQQIQYPDSGEPRR